MSRAAFEKEQTNSRVIYFRPDSRHRSNDEDFEFKRMLFMVIEHFKNNDPKPVRERFFREGRMLPEGVAYHVSWVDLASARCFQVVEAEDARMLHAWTSHWDDLIDFEIIPILTSQDYWTSFSETP
jgi:hypothetical protein